MIPLVAPTITNVDRQRMRDAAWNGMLDDERSVIEFEHAFAERVGCAKAVAVNSGTSALMIALRLTDGDGPISAPSYSCTAIANAAGARLELVDSSYDVEQARMTQAPASVLVHMFGRSTDMAPAGLFYVEDYTLSLGAVEGLSAQLGVCSTAATKMISTGRGGVIFGNDSDLVARAYELAYYDLVPSGLLGAYSLGMASTQAALGLSQLSQLDTFIERRQAYAAAYSLRFAAAGIPCPSTTCGSVFYRYLISVDDPERCVDQLALRGIEAGRGVFPPLHRYYGLDDAPYPWTMASVRSLLSVPCHPSLTEAQVDYIAEQVCQVAAP